VASLLVDRQTSETVSVVDLIQVGLDSVVVVVIVTDVTEVVVVLQGPIFLEHDLIEPPATGQVVRVQEGKSQAVAFVAELRRNLGELLNQALSIFLVHNQEDGPHAVWQRF